MTLGGQQNEEQLVLLKKFARSAIINDMKARMCGKKLNLESEVGAVEIAKEVNFKCLCSSQICERILIAIDKVNKVNKVLQKETLSVSEAIKMVKGMCDTIQEIKDVTGQQSTMVHNHHRNLKSKIIFLKW